MTTTECGRAVRVGVSSIDITPAVGIAMQGYKLRQATGITDPLLVSALAVQSDTIEWLLLSVDLIGLDRKFTSGVRTVIADRLSMSPLSVTISCSHTHSGPATLPHLGEVPGDDNYLMFLEDKLIAVAEKAASTLQPASWRIGVSVLPQNINRRLRRRGAVELDTDPNGPVDSRLRVIRIDRATDSNAQPPLALVVHYACHATTSGGVPHISADWPGAMRGSLQRIYTNNGDSPVICFLQGCTGDLTHRIGRSRTAWPRHFQKETAVESQILGRLAAAAAIYASERSVSLSVQSVRTVVAPINLPFADGSGSETTELQLIRLGPLPANRHDKAGVSAFIIGLPGEPFSVYGTQLGRKFHHEFGVDQDNVLVCGYTNDCVGYFCTPKALQQGGYEASIAHKMYHRPAAFSAATQKIIFDYSTKAARALLAGAPARQPRIFSGGLNALTRWLSQH